METLNGKCHWLCAHKLQGTTLNWAATDLDKESFTIKQMYVVLRRMNCVDDEQ
jgi:hypothetical protein